MMATDSMTELVDQWNRLFDPFGLTRACVEVQQVWLAHPGNLRVCMERFNSGLQRLHIQAWKRLSGVKVQEREPSAKYDERFQDPAWADTPYMEMIKEYYLLYTHWLEDAIYNTPGAPMKTKKKAAFYMSQLLDAAAPANYFLTNPAAVRKLFDTGGQSMLSGMKNFLADARSGTIRMVDETAFKVGENLANTPGAVIYRCELFELIQYTPVTKQVHQVPLLFVPPWINKFYILDLGEKKSMVRYLVSRGYSVFLISWKNPGSEMHDTTLDDYMLAVLSAVKVVKAVCKAPHVHAAGYCIGGTILAALMAWLAREQQDEIGSWSLFTALTDFSNPGEIDTFIDEESVAYIKEIMRKKGYLDGQKMADSFRLLRSNALIWHYFVHSYLYGENLPQFDVLYWNMDSTRLPRAMHSFYLREFYLNNKLVQPGGVTLGGRALDLRDIGRPLYAVGTEQDHIAPWKETFKICQLVQGSVRYTLTSSGHIMGIINPPVHPPKRSYLANDATGKKNPGEWTAKEVPGSWWEDWDEWLSRQCGPLADPPSQGDYPRLGDAPGNYVLER
ncbi:MAG: alpha/beta fold hydrolase [Gammaproteobacteria bacterium]|nr:alpha/beta fold hydrolase [Gammaproteobacteria bacterium]